MGRAFADMLPYTLGLIVSPFPIVAVIALLVSDRGRAKATVFEVTWLLASWLVLFGLIALLGAVGVTGQDPPRWVAYVALAIGVALVAATFVGVRRRSKRTLGTAPETPRWVAAMDTMTPPRIVGVATLLIVANPVNLTSLVGAAIAGGGAQLSPVEQGTVAAIFVIIGSAGVLAPYLGTSTGDGEQRLHRLRAWLIQHNGALTLLLVLAFGLLFIAKGLRGMFP